MGSVGNGSGPSLRVWVRVGTEPDTDWRPGLSTNPTVDSGTVPSLSPYPCELGGFSVGYTAGPSVNSYNMLALAILL